MRTNEELMDMMGMVGLTCECIGPQAQNLLRRSHHKEVRIAAGAAIVAAAEALRILGGIVEDLRIQSPPSPIPPEILAEIRGESVAANQAEGNDEANTPAEEDESSYRKRFFEDVPEDIVDGAFRESSDTRIAAALALQRLAEERVAYGESLESRLNEA